MRKLYVSLVSILFGLSLFGQTAPDKYWVQFIDKAGSPFSIDNPEEFLSEKGIDRREAQGIAVIEQDIPVNQEYINQVLELGDIELLLKSKWFNSITIKTTDLSLISEIEQLDIVSTVKSLKLYKKSNFKEEEYEHIQKNFNPNDYGTSYDQLEELNGEALHEYGYLGKNMLIFVSDGGFTNLNNVDAFNHLFEDNRIVGTHDFVDGDDNVFHASTHGTSVMGTMAGVIPNQLKGTAPEASYFLARTEDVGSEFVIEEDNWIAAAEMADSLGADIISTSLSYTTFDSSSQNHSYEDLDGETTRIAIGAGIAAEKGMLIVVSAGNYFTQSWHYIGSPADAYGILAIGGITKDSLHSSFSSAGPSADGRVKPEIAARGTAAVTANSGNNGVSNVNGTSFSAPIISGISACLWQAFPSATSIQIREAIIQSAHLYTNPNDLMGYGIPNYGIAMDYLKDLLGLAPAQDPVASVIQRVYPNPFTDFLIIEMRAPNASSDDGVLSLIDSKGSIVDQIDVKLEGDKINIVRLETYNLAYGLYTIEYIGSQNQESIKVVHL